MDKWIKENRITTAIILLLIAVFFMVFFDKQNYKTQNQVSKAISPGIADIDSQIKCASQAKIFFEYFVSDPQERQNDEYSNYYNQKLNKCFVLIKHGITSINDFYTKNLFDAIEKKQYGSYGWESQQGKKYWEVPPFDCALYPDGNQPDMKVCRSEGEFDDFVKGYMEN